MSENNWFVKEVEQGKLQDELNAFQSQGWTIYQLHPVEADFRTYWTIICCRVKP